MISQETIDGLIDALDSLSDATNSIIHGGGELPTEAQVINSLNSSSTTDALSANMGRELKERIEAQTPAGAYTKTETDTLLDRKADKSITYTKTEVNTALNGKADVGDSYTKSESNALLVGKADTSTTYTKSEVNTSLEGKANTSDVYSKSQTYSKLEVDALVQGGGTPVDAYTKAQTDALLTTKADVSTTYTKAEVDTSLSAKANASTTYTKTDVDTALSGKASTTDVTNKANLKLATSDNTATGEIRFGKDGDGNYGYIPEGADTVIPFSSGGGNPALVAEYMSVGRLNSNNHTLVKKFTEYDTSKYDTNNLSPSSTQKFFMYVTSTSTANTTIFDDDYITCLLDSNQTYQWTPKVACVYRRNGYKPQELTAGTTISLTRTVGDLYCFQFYDN